MSDRPARRAMPRRLISLIWLPVIVWVVAVVPDQQVRPSWLLIGLVPGVGAWLLFALRDRMSHTEAALSVVALAGGGLLLLFGSDGWTASAGFPMLAAFLAGMRLPARVAAVAGTLITVAMVIAVGPYESWWDPVLVAGAIVIMVAFGMARREGMRRTEEHERALVADARAREEHARAETIADRARVARDVHDVLAHSLSALAVQLQGARLMAIRDGAADDTIAQIERAQRLASDGISEVRRAVRALREGPAPVNLDAELRELADAHPNAAVDVDPGLRLGPREGETVLRTTQEALSNARKHAPGAPVTIRLHARERDAELEIVDVAGAPPGPGDGQGSGLIGMAERAALVGAELETGPTADGWRVALRLPGAVRGAEPDPAPADATEPEPTRDTIGS